MNREDRYVRVSDRLWTQYSRAAPRGLERRLLHARIFYGVKRLRSMGDYKPGYRYVVHPIAAGHIPRGHAVREEYYVNETRHTVRSEREVEKTASAAVERAL